MKNIDKIKEEIIYYGKQAGVKNFTPGVSGNISARIGDRILITASGSANGYLAEDDIVTIDFNGNLIEGSKKPSSEKMLHVEYYKQRSDINCIFHMHSPYLSAFAACGKALDEPIMPENIFYFGQIPLAKYALPGSKKLVEETSKYFKDYNVILMANHGMISAGENIRDAYLKLELAESYAQVILMSKNIGTAKLLSEQEVEEINSLKHNCNEKSKEKE